MGRGMSDAEGNKARIKALDRDLDKLARAKGGKKGWLWPFLFTITLIVVIVPVGWVLVYRFVEAPGTILMVERAIGGEKIQRSTVPIREISPHLVRAVIAAEDARFCAHDGFDVEAIEDAMAYNEKMEDRGSKRRRGASTISQQTAKNLFLWPERSWVRKGLEVYFTGLIEMFWPKRRIMEAYLNAAEWGDGRFGAEAAARDMFNKSAAALTANEAARLAAVLPSPNKWRADRPGPYVARRVATIQQRMNVVASDGLAGCVLNKPGEDGPTVQPTKRKPKPAAPVIPAPEAAVTEDAPPPAVAPPPELTPTPEAPPEAPTPPAEDPPPAVAPPAAGPTP
jgi:monofunctional glycosyltransferase